MSESRSSVFRVVSCFILMTLCIVVFLGATIFMSIPKRAEQIFGAANPNLGLITKTFYSAKLLLAEEDLTQAFDPAGTPQEFQVAFGEPTVTIIHRLYDDGFISNEDAFRTYLQFRGLDTTIQAGSYMLSPGMSALEIAAQLQDATPTHVEYTILPGWRLEEIASSLPTSGLNIAPENFLRAASAPVQGFSFTSKIPLNGSIEGFFLPGTYEIHRDTNVGQFIRQILTNFEKSITPDLLQGFNRQGMDIYQAVTLASIVEREAVNDEEMPLIASVFHNRLQTGMKLDADPTVQYAVGYNPQQNTWWTSPLSLEDLKTDTPYNTYIYPGLPPGPIANPSLTALRAVAFPAQTPYYYFRAACGNSGKHIFAETFEEHQANTCP